MKRVYKVTAFVFVMAGVLLAVATSPTYAASPRPSHDDTAPACRAAGAECAQNPQCCSKSCSVNCTRHGQSVYCCM
jgi:hypothetical protein